MSDEPTVIASDADPKIILAAIDVTSAFIPFAIRPTCEGIYTLVIGWRKALLENPCTLVSDIDSKISHYEEMRKALQNLSELSRSIIFEQMMQELALPPINRILEFHRFLVDEEPDPHGEIIGQSFSIDDVFDETLDVFAWPRRTLAALALYKDFWTERGQLQAVNHGKNGRSRFFATFKKR